MIDEKSKVLVDGKLTIISFGGPEEYCPIILAGGNISGKKLRRVVNRKFWREAKKEKVFGRKKYKTYGDDIIPKIASLLVKKHGFRYAIADEFYMDWSDPKERHYWIKNAVKR